MSDFHIVVIFNDYYTLIVAFLTKQMQNRNRRFPNTPVSHLVHYAYVLFVLQINQLGYEIKLMKLPKLCVYGTKDTFVDQSIQEISARKFGFRQEQFDIYNDDNQIIQKG